MTQILALTDPGSDVPAAYRGARELVGRSPAIARVQELVKRAALLEGGVLLVAPRGTDVQSVARELHDRRDRSRPYVHVDCSAGDPNQLERLLFGGPAGGGTDLESPSRDACVAAAVGGTLFLRDIGDLSAAVQARLARVARDGEIRVDGTRRPTNLRMIGSAAPGIDGDVQAGRFRSDLYRRLATWRIDLPALRDRAEDIPAIATRVLEDFCTAAHGSRRSFTQPALSLLGALTWPGNVMELAALVERVATETTHPVVQIEDVLPALQLDRSPAAFAPCGTLREARLRFEREYIAAVLQHHRWRMADAAQTLGIQRPNLYRKARQLGIPLTRVTD